MELKQNERFLKKAYNKALLPCVLSVLSGNINILADGILVGQRLGTDALAAVNFSLPVYLVLCIAGSFIVSGTAVCASDAIGKNRTETAQRLYQMSIFWCTAVSVFIAATGLIFLEPLSLLLCSDRSVTPLVAEYAGVTLAGALPKILIYIPFWFLRLDGRNGQVTLMMLIMGAGNVVLDVIFLYALDMGILGAALASVLSTAAACVLGFARLCDKRSGFPFGFRVKCDDIKFSDIAKAGSPSAANNLFQTLRVSVINALLLRYCGSGTVAAFTAVNCIAAFGESVTSGVPQAASAMLGIYNGERDNESTRLLMARQLKSGIPCALIFSAVIILGADLVGAAYGLDISLRFAFICLSLGMIPALVNCVLSGYYNVSGRVFPAVGIIFMRVFAISCASLFALLYFGQSPWLFLFFGEIFTLAVWFVCSGIAHKRNPKLSRFLLTDNALEESGNVINFSVNGDAESICDASGRITDFCGKNGMSPKQTMRISLAMEEIMTLIAEKNESSAEFDLRVYSLNGTIGIRIRCGGEEFNPLAYSEGDEEYMGIRLIESICEQTLYRRTFGTNTVQIFIEGSAQ
ncbi:MAG: MATE family efflux transporter [Prevotella sp.]|nr:MATE family efflux transporter [Prevotella sp.]